MGDAAELRVIGVRRCSSVHGEGGWHEVVVRTANFAHCVYRWDEQSKLQSGLCASKDGCS